MFANGIIVAVAEARGVTPTRNRRPATAAIGAFRSHLKVPSACATHEESAAALQDVTVARLVATLKTACIGTFRRVLWENRPLQRCLRNRGLAMMTAYSSKTARPDQHAGAATTPVVFIVDDDDLIRSSVRRLLTNANLATELYASGAEFLAQARIERPSCLILDFKMPGMNGLEVQASLKQRRIELPVIFLTGSSDIPIAVAAMREGAADFVEKPFDNAYLLTRVRQAIERSSKWWQDSAERRGTLQRFDLLTARERSVFELVVVGKTNKEIARDLGASYRTIEIHRRRVMEKMAAPTLADLVRMRADIDADPIDSSAADSSETDSP